MGRRRQIEAAPKDAQLLRVSRTTVDICKSLSGMRKTSAGEAAEYLITKYGPPELEKLMKAAIKKMDKGA